jgi:hypothetical protein
MLAKVVSDLKVAVLLWTHLGKRKTVPPQSKYWQRCFSDQCNSIDGCPGPEFCVFALNSNQVQSETGLQ